MHIRAIPWAAHRLALLLLLLTVMTLHSLSVYAHGENPTDGHHDEEGEEHPPASAPVQPLDKTCIDGTITNGDGSRPIVSFPILATPFDSSGNLDTQSAITSHSDQQGRFYLEQGLFPARWQVEVQPVDGWEALSTVVFPIELGFGRTTCISLHAQFLQAIFVTVQKSDGNGLPLAGWRVRAQPGSGNQATIPQEAVTDANGLAILKLSPGLWRWSTASPSGSAYRPVWLNGQPLQSYLTAPGPFMLRLDLRGVRTGCVDVHQHQMDATGATATTHLPGWRIELQRADGLLISAKRSDQEGTVKFANLPIGAYRVVQSNRTGWTAMAPTGFAVAVMGGDGCEQVNFYNEPLPPASPSACRLTHVVTPGEGLSMVGARYGVRFQAMINANPWVVNRYRMYLKVGDRVCIP